MFFGLMIKCEILWRARGMLTALYAWHVQVNYKILTGGPSVVRGDYLWQPCVVRGDRLWGDHRWHDRTSRFCQHKACKEQNAGIIGEMHLISYNTAVQNRTAPPKCLFHFVSWLEKDRCTLIEQSVQ